MRVGAKERAEARAVAEMPGSFAECWREIQDLRTRVATLEAAMRDAGDSFRSLGCAADADDLDRVLSGTSASAPVVHSEEPK